MIVHIVTSLKDFFLLIYVCICVYAHMCMWVCAFVHVWRPERVWEPSGLDLQVFYRTSDLLQVLGSELWSLVLLVAELAL